jgi:hypothetical protein
VLPAQLPPEQGPAISGEGQFSFIFVGKSWVFVIEYLFLPTPNLLMIFQLPQQISEGLRGGAEFWELEPMETSSFRNWWVPRDLSCS